MRGGGGESLNKWARLGLQYLPGLVQRALGIAGDVDGRLDSAYQLGVTALDLTDPQYAWLGRGKRYCAGIALAGGGAGVFTGFGLSNIAGAATSKRLVICRRFRFANQNASYQQAAFGMYNAGALPVIGGLTRVQPLDSRQDAAGSPSTPAPLGVFLGGNAIAAAPAGTAAAMLIGPDQAVELVPEGGAIVLAPNTAFVVQYAVANLPGGAWVEWEERDATEFE